MKVSVIISTSSSPSLLQKCLWGFEYQTYNNFDVIITEEGQDQQTAALIKDFSERGVLNIRHITDPGGRAREIAMLNRAIAATSADYLIFSNDHCVPRNDFVEIHMKRSRKQHFLSGGYFSVPHKVASAITKEDIATLFAFNWRWLYYNGLQPGKLIGMTNQRLLDRLFEKFSSSVSWCGANASAWRDDILSINGFNEDLSVFEYDVDFGERLIKRGVNGISVRHEAICLCQEGKRTIRNGADKKADRNRTRLQTGAWAVNGISKAGAADLRERKVI